MLGSLTSEMLARWPEMFPGQAHPKSLSYVIVPGSLENGTVTFLAFEPGARWPSFAAKAQRVAGGADEFAREAAALEAAVRAAPESPVPRLLFSRRVQGRRVSAYSIVPGRSMSAPSRWGGSPNVPAAVASFDSAAAWLGRLAAAADRSEAARADIVQQGVKHCDEFLALRDSPRGTRLAHSVRATLTLLARPGATLIHGDFCRQNVLVDADGTLSVIDWNDARPRGFLLHDLFFFMATYFLQERRRPGLGGLIDSFDLAFIKPGPYSAAVARRAQMSARASGLPPEGLRLALARFLLEQSVREAHKVRACVEAGAPPRLSRVIAEESGLSPKLLSSENMWFHFFERLAERENDCVL